MSCNLEMAMGVMTMAFNLSLSVFGNHLPIHVYKLEYNVMTLYVDAALSSVHGQHAIAPL